LTFQEYLTAVAVRDENRQGVTIQTLADKHRDARWREVILLFCRIAPPALARSFLDAIRRSFPPQGEETKELGSGDLVPQREHAELLLSAFSSCASPVCGDPDYRATILGYILSIPVASPIDLVGWGDLERSVFRQCPFSHHEISMVIITRHTTLTTHDSYPLGINWANYWLLTHSKEWEADPHELDACSELTAADLRQVIWRYYCFSSYSELSTNGIRPEIWRAPLSDDPRFAGRHQAEAVLLGLTCRIRRFCGPQGGLTRTKNLFDYIPEALLVELLECYNEGTWEKTQHQSLFFYMFGGTTSLPSTRGLSRRFTAVCSAITERLGTMSGAEWLRNWVQSFSTP
jgi:hypothetical protein